MHSLAGRLQAVCHLLALSGTGQAVLAWIKIQVFKNQGDCVSQKALGAPGMVMCKVVKMLARGLSEVRSPSLVFTWPWVLAGPGTPESENIFALSFKYVTIAFAFGGRKRWLPECPGLGWIRVYFLPVSGTVLCFGFTTTRLLTTRCCFSRG